MPRPALHVCLATAVLALGACGGGAQPRPKQRDTAASRGPAASGTVASAAPRRPVRYRVDDLRRVLIRPHDVGRDVRTRPATFPGLTNAAAPICSASTVRLPGRPTTIGRQLEAAPRGYRGAHYIQLLAVYPDPPAAARALARLRARAAACARKRRVPAERLSKTSYAPAHTDTWRVTRDGIGGWDHVRGFEKHLDPPALSRLNVFYDVYDYVRSRNVVMASLYWERVDPTVTRGQLIARRATRVLHKQLNLIDGR